MLGLVLERSRWRLWLADQDPGPTATTSSHLLPRLDGVAVSLRVVTCITLIPTFLLQTNENRHNLVIDDTTGQDGSQISAIASMWRNALLAIETHQIPHPTPTAQELEWFRVFFMFFFFTILRLSPLHHHGVETSTRPCSITSPSARHNLSNQKVSPCINLTYYPRLSTSSRQAANQSHDLVPTDGSRSREHGGEYLAQIGDIMTEFAKF